MSFVNGTGQDLAVEDPNLDLAAAEGGYIAPDVETDQDAISEQVFTALSLRASGWQAHDGNLEVWLTEAWAAVAAEVRALCRDVPASIFETYGGQVLGIPPKIALAASGTATFTAQDALGYTLDPGTQFALARSGNDLVAFATLQEAEIAPGDTTVDVPVAAVLPGADANGLSGGGQMLDPVTWVASVTVDTATSQGQDAELPQDYLDRLTNLLRMVALRPILPQDFAILALQHDSVGRAVAMNLYDPGTGTWTNARTVTLVLTDPSGQPCTTAVKNEVAAALDALREVNWVIHIIDATYVPVAVDFAVTAYAGQNAQTVHDACVSNLQTALAPVNYRLGEQSPAMAGGEVINPPTAGQPTRRQVLHVNDFVSLLDRTLGVDFVAAGQVKLNGAATDLQLTAPYALPTPGTITGVVSGAAT